jgi:hypothetical protein
MNIHLLGAASVACARALRRGDQEKRTETETHRGEIFVLALVPREFMEILKFMGDFVEKFFLQGAEYYILQLAVLSYENFLRSALSRSLSMLLFNFILRHTPSQK